MRENAKQEKRIKVKITNTEIFNSFIKIKAQDVESDEFIALLDLKSLFKSIDETHNDDIKLSDNIYIARMDFDNYARCRILELNDFSASATIELIDSGYKSKVGYNQLRILPKSSNLFNLPSISKDYILAELILSREFTDYLQKFKKFHELVCNKFFDADILSENNAGKYVQLYSIEASITHDIIPNHPTLKTILKRINLVEQMNLMQEQFINESCDGNFDSSNSQVDISLLEYSSIEQFQQDEMHEVIVSAYENGPKLFYVQSIKSLSVYQDFLVKLQKLTLQPLKFYPNKLQICLAFLGCNNVQRVKIMEIRGEMLKVRLIDYGFERMVNQTDLFEIPDDIRSQKPFAWKFALHKIEKLDCMNPLELNFYFHYITNQKRLNLKTRTEFNESINKCTLFDGSKNIFDMLKAYNPCALRYPQQKSLSNTHNVKIIFADSPRLFYINICDSTTPFEATFAEFSNFSPVIYQNPVVGSACCVKICDRNYRGRLEKKISTAICQIKLIDIGFIEDFSCNEVKVMVDKFTKIPPLAYKCSLIEYKNKDCYPNVVKSFIMKCKQHQTFRMSVKEVDGDLYYVSLENDLGKNVADELMSPSKYCTKCHTREQMNTEDNSMEDENDIDITMIEYDSSFIPPPIQIDDWTIKERIENGEVSVWNDSKAEISSLDYNFIGKVSSVISPTDFTIQCLDSLPKIEEMLNDLQKSAENEYPLTSFINNTHCTARNPYTEKWCRAIILDAYIKENNTLLTVKDIDNGQIFSLEDLSQVKTASIKSLLHQPFGIRCELPIKIRQNFEDEAMRLFIETVSKDIRYKIIACNQFINTCDILCDGKNVTDFLVEMKVATKLKVIPNGPAYITHVENLNNFYVQLKSQSECVNNMEILLNSYERINLKVPVKGLMVLSKSRQFGKWYRAKIISIDGEEIEVKYIDFGNKEKVTIRDLGIINDRLIHLSQSLAHRCSLNLPKNFDPNTLAAIEYFRKIAKNGYQEIILRMIEPKLNRSIVEIYMEKEEMNILNELIPLCTPIEVNESVSSEIDSKISEDSICSENFD